MIDSPSWSDIGSASDTHSLFGQTMGYVAATAGFFVLGAYLARDASYVWGLRGYIAALVCLIAMKFARQSARASTGLLFAFGLLFGVAMSPTISYYAGANPQALWQAGGATASGSPPS